MARSNSVGAHHKRRFGPDTQDIRELVKAFWEDLGLNLHYSIYPTLVGDIYVEAVVDIIDGEGNCATIQEGKQLTRYGEDIVAIMLQLGHKCYHKADPIRK